jgi:FkbM family methyltransferase
MSDLVTISTPLAKHPLWCRFTSTDLHVFWQIFIARQYAPLDDLTNVSHIVDLGANVGYSTAYFLTRFPKARSIAVEPDPANFEVLARNLAPYGKRATAIHAGVWSHVCSLGIVESTAGAGREWGRQVREVASDYPGAVPGLDLGTLLSAHQINRVSLLKVDIEGAEAVVFRERNPSWLERIDNIAIELHNNTDFGECSAAFQRSIGEQGFAQTRSGELTLCRRIRVRARRRNRQRSPAKNRRHAG